MQPLLPLLLLLTPVPVMSPCKQESAFKLTLLNKQKGKRKKKQPLLPSLSASGARDHIGRLSCQVHHRVKPHFEFILSVVLER